MSLPLYQDANAPSSRPATGHAGLWFERFFAAYDPNWQIAQDRREDGQDPKDAWLQGMVGKCGDGDLLKAMTTRRAEMVESLGGAYRTFRLEGRLATGMGYPHPVENGFAWHPTLGGPYLTGAAVKGLLRAFCEAWDNIDSDAERLARWFGVGSGEKDGAESAGALQFFEAIPLSPPTLKVDIMTPHMGKWYEQGDAITDPWDSKQSDKVPGDWHDPTPIPFLTVENATFLFAVAPRRPSQEVDGEVAEALDKLTEALEWLGAGAKTAVGYGHMVPDDKQQRDLDQQLQAAQQAQQEAEREQELASLSPEERALKEYEDLLQQERDAGRTDRGSSPLTGQARRLMDQAEEEGWSAEQCQRLAALVSAAYKFLDGIPKNKKKEIQAQLARLRGEQ